MRVLHIISGMDPKAGGVTTAVNTIIDGLTDLEVKNEVACLDDPAEVFIRDVPFIHGLGPSKTAWRYSPEMRPWLNENLARFDAIIIHGLWQYQVYAVYKAWRAMKKRPKLLMMPHGMLDPYFQKAEGRKIKAIRNWLFWKFVEGPAVNHADGLLFTCETEKILSYQSFSPYQPKRAYIAGLGIPAPAGPTAAMEKAFSLKCGEVDVKGCLLYISRIHPKKGVDLLINVYREQKKLNASLPKLVIAGPGLDTDFGRAMQSLAAGTEDIIFTGMLQGDEKWGAFHSCAAMILPSHQENFGFVVVEALACGKPVLISNQVNIWREVYGEGGGIVHDDTAEGTQRMLAEWLALSEEQKAEMERNARATFEHHFSLKAASGKLFTILKEICHS